MNKKLNYAWLLSLLMIFSITFVSCSKDDDDEVSINKDELIGTWKGDKQTIAGEEFTLNETIEFKKDGKCTIKYGATTMNYEWNVKGSKLTLDYQGIESEYSVSINGTKLTLTEEYEDEDDTTVKITKTYNKQ